MGHEARRTLRSVADFFAGLKEIRSSPNLQMSLRGSVTPMVKKIPFRDGAFDDCHPALSSDTVKGQLSSVSHA